MPHTKIRVRLAVLHAAFDPKRAESFARIEEQLLQECKGLEDRVDLHFYRELDARGSLLPWLGIMRDGVARAWEEAWRIGPTEAARLFAQASLPKAYVTTDTADYARSLGIFAPTHLAFLPDDVTLGKNYVRGLLKAIVARPDDVFCTISNHAEAEAMRQAGVRWYATRDAWNGLGAMPVRFAADHLLWRRSELLPEVRHVAEGGTAKDRDRIVQHDEGVSLHLMSLGKPIYKTLPGMLQHDDPHTTLDESFISAQVTAKDREATRIRRSSVSFDPDLDLATIAWDDGPTLDAGRSYRGTHWSLVFDMKSVDSATIEQAYSCERDRGYMPETMARDVAAKVQVDTFGVHGRPHVWISVPEYQPALPAMRLSLERQVAALRRAGILVDVDLVTGQSLVTRARNWGCVHRFLCSRANVLFQWDGDVECLDDHAIEKMLAGPHPVCAVAYPFRGGKVGRMCATLPHDPASKNPMAKRYAVDEAGFCPAHEVATGFLMVRRHVITDLCARHPELMHEQDGGNFLGAPAWALFDTRLEECGRGRRRRYLSEDWEFCRLCREAGYTPHLYIPSKLRHWGLSPADGHPEVAWGGKLWEDVYEADPLPHLKGKA